MIAFVLWADRTDLFSRGRRWKAALMLGLVILPTAITILGLETVYMSRYYPFKGVACYAAENTPKDSLILTEPAGGNAFRTWSGRSVVMAKADKNFFGKQDREVLINFTARVDKAYQRKKVRVLMRYAREFGADYVVLPLDGSEEVENARNVRGDYYLSPVWTRRHHGKDDPPLEASP